MLILVEYIDLSVVGFILLYVEVRERSRIIIYELPYAVVGSEPLAVLGIDNVEITLKGLGLVYSIILKVYLVLNKEETAY